MSVLQANSTTYAGTCGIGEIFSVNKCTPCSDGTVANPQQTQCILFCGTDSSLDGTNKQCLCNSNYVYDPSRKVCGMSIFTNGLLTTLVAGIAIILCLSIMVVHIINNKLINKEETKKQQFA